jgi:BirA family biotin operon repressor/biotin-[acetyl-CoA-carboxylase] ligase
MGDHPASRGASPAHRRASTLRPERWDVRRFATLDSTNRWLLDRARAGAPPGLVAVADHQEAGRGRRGRTWTAPAGSSLLASVLLAPDVPAGELHVVTMRVALALSDALGSSAGVRAELKWPNDLVVGDRKIAGLLAEADIGGASVRAVVVGFGCNLTQTTFPVELQETATSVVLEAGASPSRDELLASVLSNLDERLGASSDSIRHAYRDRLATLGREVRVELDGRTVAGLARDIDASGRLVVEGSLGEVEVVSVGDVVHLRPAGG